MSADGGQTWALASVPSGIGVLQSTACLSTSVCLAAGTTGTTVSDVVPAKGELLRSTDGGHTWEPSTGPLPVDDVYGMACPSADQCAMVGTFWFGLPAVGVGAVAQSIDAGLTFRSSPTSYIPITLTAVACPSTSRCIAVGGDTVARITLLQPKQHPPRARRPRAATRRPPELTHPAPGRGTGRAPEARPSVDRGDPSSGGSHPRRLGNRNEAVIGSVRGYTRTPVARTMEERHAADLPAVSERSQRRCHHLPELRRRS